MYADVDEQSKNEIKDILLSYDRTLLVADPRRAEPKKYVLSSALFVCLAPGSMRLNQQGVENIRTGDYILTSHFNHL